MGATKKQAAVFQALLATLFGGVISYNLPNRPDVPVLYVSAPEPVGAVYMELDPKHLPALFDSFPVFEDLEPAGRPISEAFADFRVLLARMPKVTYAKPTYGEP